MPTDNTYNRYYLVEWRTNTKYDGMVAKTAYIHNYADETNGDVVSRIPYNMPADLLYYRDTKYGSTYAMVPNEGNPPSFGSKYQLLIVDQNWEPMRIFSGTVGSPDAYEGYWTGRVSSYDAGLTLQATDAFTIPTYYGIEGLPPQVYESKPAVTSFNDTLGYYGGFYYGAPCPIPYICYNEADGSAVIPARGAYSTRIIDFYGDPIYPIYGSGFPPSWLGSGNPGGDSYGDSVQFGVNIDLVSKAGDDAYNSTATLRFRNYSVDFINTVSEKVAGGKLEVTYQTVVDNVGNEAALGVELYYELDSALSFVSVSAEASDGTAIDIARGTDLKDVEARSDAAPEDELTLIIPTLAAGEKVTVTVVAEMPYSGGPVALYSELWPNDGQVDRGPWWLDSSIDLSLTFLPLVLNE